MGEHTGGDTHNGDQLIPQQLFDARIKANEIVQEHLKQIIMIASGTLVLTVSFLKDIVGSSGPKSADPRLLPTSWVALGFAIFFAVICLATLVNNLDVPDQTARTGLSRAFTAGTKKHIIILEWLTLIAFATGMFSLAAFGAVNSRLFLERETGAQTDAAVQAAKNTNHFTIVAGNDHIGPKGKDHSHTFLLDQKSGSVWDVYGHPDGTVEFRRVSVDGISERKGP